MLEIFLIASSITCFILSYFFYSDGKEKVIKSLLNACGNILIVSFCLNAIIPPILTVIIVFGLVFCVVQSLINNRAKEEKIKKDNDLVLKARGESKENNESSKNIKENIIKNKIEKEQENTIKVNKPKENQALKKETFKKDVVVENKKVDVLKIKNNNPRKIEENAKKEILKIKPKKKENIIAP